MSRTFSFSTVVVLLILVLIYTHTFPYLVGVPSPPDLQRFPMNFGDWSCDEGVPEPAIYFDEGADKDISRTCTNIHGEWLWLYIGYFWKQEVGKHVSSPRLYYPDRHWNYVESQNVLIFPPKTEGGTFYASSVTIRKGGNRQLLTYWYQIQKRGIGNEYRFRWRTTVNALLRGRTDTFIIRIASPFRTGSPETDREIQQKFAGLVFDEVNAIVSISPDALL